MDAVPRDGPATGVRARQRWLVETVLLAVPFLFYLGTCAPGLGSSDTAIAILHMRELVLSPHANHHNLTSLAGWALMQLPMPSLAFAANLVSVLMGTAAIRAFFGLVREVHGRAEVAAIASLSLMVSHSMWWHSTIVESYALNALLTVLAVRALHRLRKGFTVLAVARLFALGGLALYNHAQMGIVLLGAVAAAVAHLTRAPSRGAELRRLVPAAALGFAAGFSPFAITFAHRAIRGGGLRQAASLALGGDFKALMFKGSLFDGLREVGRLAAFQYPSPFLLAVVVGAVLLVRQWRGTPGVWGLAVMFAVNTGFFATYRTWDLFAFLLPSFVMLAFGASFAVERVVAWVGRDRLRIAVAIAALAACVLLPPAVYDGLARAAQRPGPLRARHGGEVYVNSVDIATYLIDPDKHDYRDFDRFTAALFRALPPGAVYVDDDSRTYYQLAFYWQRYYRQRPDVGVLLVNAWGLPDWGLTGTQFAATLREARQASRPLFLASLEAPYTSLLAAAPDALQFRFRRFPLDERRWVYKLLTVDEERAAPPTAPRVLRLVVGLAMDSARPEVRTELARDDAIMAALEYELNLEPFAVRFEWLDPTGQVHFTSELAVPAGHRVAWTSLGRPPLASGTWRVRALHAPEGREMARADFTVR